MKEKNLSIEFLKFIAVVVVLNSHLTPLYGKYNALAFGGAIGDALFFFASGYTLFLGRFGRFDNWYKRRIKRIYPSLIAWAAVLSFAGFKQLSLSQIVCGRGYWFVSCIMVYYIVLYLVRKYFLEKPIIPFVICTVVVLLWYCFVDSHTQFMYRNTQFRLLYYFFFMLAGAYVGNNTFKLKSKPLADTMMLTISLLMFYGIRFLCAYNVVVAHLQVFTLAPLMGVVIYTYKLCCANGMDDLLRTKFGLVLRFLAGLCLEVYIVQVELIKFMTGYMNSVFPLNIFVTCIFTVIIAYLTRCLGRIVSQIFEKEDFDWRVVVKAV